jgi:hypothetical protein
VEPISLQTCNGYARKIIERNQHNKRVLQFEVLCMGCEGSVTGALFCGSCSEWRGLSAC